MVEYSNFFVPSLHPLSLSLLKRINQTEEIEKYRNLMIRAQNDCEEWKKKCFQLEESLAQNEQCKFMSSGDPDKALIRRLEEKITMMATELDRLQSMSHAGNSSRDKDVEYLRETLAKKDDELERLYQTLDERKKDIQRLNSLVLNSGC